MKRKREGAHIRGVKLVDQPSDPYPARFLVDQRRGESDSDGGVGEDDSDYSSESTCGVSSRRDQYVRTPYATAHKEQE